MTVRICAYFFRKRFFQKKYVVFYCGISINTDMRVYAYAHMRTVTADIGFFDTYVWCYLIESAAP